MRIFSDTYLRTESSRYIFEVILNRISIALAERVLWVSIYVS